ncbi:Carboxylesterase [Desulfobulbus propionicus DSM 2032]|uniref:Carboxylesterase n=1 Tax=Desulfobulbus propionicus (strain ATCC 33891 / DSM 2032 / VKM B-1956 / 1pr3) TaxID=577650 RepID=A0A7U3YLY4_DESPD|nr:dienelactone hydrolase family protein [Desulfobulbus propionicus]ADW17810.1 Carboxylesterase [Desulfobulbus propionicus DSM 2032]
MTLLPAIEQETRPDPDASVIWLHGLGANGYDFAPIVPELNLPDTLAIRFIFPHAPAVPVTVNGGYVMPAWFDILEMDIDRRVDSDQLLRSAAAITRFIERERERGIASRRIILAGFSQGGAVAYQVSLSHLEPLGGLIAMSTYFATSDSIALSEANLDLPIEIHHGLYDQVVPQALGIRAAEFLKDRGYAVVFRTYPMEHAVCPRQIAHISEALQRLLHC